MHPEPSRAEQNRPESDRLISAQFYELSVYIPLHLPRKATPFPSLRVALENSRHVALSWGPTRRFRRITCRVLCEVRIKYMTCRALIGQLS